MFVGGIWVLGDGLGDKVVSFWFGCLGFSIGRVLGEVGHGRAGAWAAETGIDRLCGRCDLWWYFSDGDLASRRYQNSFPGLDLKLITFFFF